MDKDTPKLLQTIWKNQQEAYYDPTKLIFANDEYYNHERKFTDSKGKKWVDVTTNISKR